MSNFYLLKSEPETYSIDQLKKDKKTNWNGVRNFQARNTLLTVNPGDLALIYHSGKDKAVVGVGKFTSKPFPDLDPKRKGDWVQVELSYVRHFSTPVTLATIKKTRELSKLPLIRHTRLSCMQITESEFEFLCQM